MPSSSPPVRNRRSHRRRGLPRRSRRRLVGLIVIFAVAFSLITWRLVSIQAIGNARYRSISRDAIQPVILSGVRGSILASNGNEMALTEMRPDIFADPTEITDAAGDAVRLAAVLGISAFRLQAELTASTSNVVLVAVATATEVRKVSELKMGGVGVRELPRRYYPDGGLALPIIGTVDAAGNGVGGMEQNYDSILRATPGALIESVDTDGRPIAGTVTHDVPAVNGDDILTTIDPALQYQVEQILPPAIESARAASGVILVMSTATGAILAAANMVAGRHGAEQAPNAFCFTHAYAPGSVGKIITVSAGLAQHKITPATKLSIPDVYDVAGDPIHDDSPEPAGTKLSPMGILAQSSNIGATKVAQRLGPDEQYRYLKAYGFTARTDIQFPGETAGFVRTPDRYYGTTLATVAYGDGYAVSAVQMISAVNAVANRGLYVAPRLVTATVDAEGREHLVKTPKPRRVIPAWVAAEMTPMLEQVVSSGTGTIARIRGYAVAGKTGTAARYSREGEVIPESYASSFAGYAPATKPAFTVLVVIDDTARFAASAAAPVFQKVMKAARVDEGVPCAGRPPAPPHGALPIVNGQPEASLLGQ
jgi:cell division protein FtsI (penicillin-binding protein 3)